MTANRSFHHLFHEASFEELWFKLRQIVQVKEIDADPDRRASACSDGCVLIVVNRGEPQFTIDDRLFSLKRGAVFLGAPGQRIAYMGNASAEEEDGCVLHFDVQGDPLVKEAFFRQVGNERGGGIAPEEFAAILTDLCEKAYFYWHHSSKWERLRSQAVFQEIVYQVLYRAKAALNQGVEAALEQIKLYLDLHYQEGASIEHLARRAGVSPRHFRRAFKQKFGISATDYVADLRMSQAKRLMAATKQPVAEIARQVGYQDESHFRRTFKNRMGLSPAMYVKNRQLKVAACSFPNIGQLLPLHIIPFAAPLDHDWTDAYRRKYHTEVLYPLHHHNEINRQTLVAAKPDRILAIDAFGSPDFQAKLGEIAPVLVIPWRTKNWREHLLMTASFLNKSKEADEWLAAYDDKADRACERWNRMAVNEKLQVIMVDRHHCYKWKGADKGRMSRSAFPFAPMRHKACMDPSFERMTPEAWSACEADRIVLLLSEDRYSQWTWKTLQRSECWNRLKAVRHDRVRPVLLGPWFEYTAYNHGVILDQAIKALS